MDTKEAIELLKMLKAEIEWDFSLQYQIALDIAIKELKKVKDKDTCHSKCKNDNYLCSECHRILNDCYEEDDLK